MVRAEWLGDLYVENWARHRGLGYRLAQFVARQAAGEGAEAMHWNVLRRNEPARQFYRHFAREDPRLLHCLAEGERLASLAGSAAVSPAVLRAAEASNSALLGGMLDGLLAALGETRFEFDASDRLLLRRLRAAAPL